MRHERVELLVPLQGLAGAACVVVLRCCRVRRSCGDNGFLSVGWNGGREREREDERKRKDGLVAGAQASNEGMCRTSLRRSGAVDCRRCR